MARIRSPRPTSPLDRDIPSPVCDSLTGYMSGRATAGASPVPGTFTPMTPMLEADDDIIRDQSGRTKRVYTPARMRELIPQPNPPPEQLRGSLVFDEEHVSWAHEHAPGSYAPPSNRNSLPRGVGGMSPPLSPSLSPRHAAGRLILAGAGREMPVLMCGTPDEVVGAGGRSWPAGRGTPFAKDRVIISVSPRLTPLSGRPCSPGKSPGGRYVSPGKRQSPPPAFRLAGGTPTGERTQTYQAPHRYDPRRTPPREPREVQVQGLRQPMQPVGSQGIPVRTGTPPRGGPMLLAMASETAARKSNHPPAVVSGAPLPPEQPSPPSPPTSPPPAEAAAAAGLGALKLNPNAKCFTPSPARSPAESPRPQQPQKREVVTDPERLREVLLEYRGRWHTLNPAQIEFYRQWKHFIEDDVPPQPPPPPAQYGGIVNGAVLSNTPADHFRAYGSPPPGIRYPAARGKMGGKGGPPTAVTGRVIPPTALAQNSPGRGPPHPTEMYM
eukprot:Hpha_TRINITY_DN12193_c0_g2::TRINITY_DN12193_c0_g2_i1::g.81884::m.81884